MSETRDFGSRVEAELERQQQAWEAQANYQETLAKIDAQERDERAAELARIAMSKASIVVLHEAKARRDRMHEGTLPRDVWGEEAQILCQDFISYVAERDFSGASILHHQGHPWVPFIRRADPSWSIRGFGVGGYGNYAGDLPNYKGSDGITRRDEFIGSNLLHTVFLCEDTKLRYYTNGTVEDRQRRTATYIPSYNEALGYIQSDPQRYENSTPNTVSDLPIQNNGTIKIPSVGVFALFHYRCREESYCGNDALEGSGVHHIIPEHYKMKLQELKLETMLVAYAASAEAGHSPATFR